MAEKDGKRSWMMVNRALLLTVWAAVVAEVLGFDHDEALTLGRAVAGLNAYKKKASGGKSLVVQLLSESWGPPRPRPEMELRAP